MRLPSCVPMWFCGCAVLTAAPISPPEVPQNLKPPAGQQVVLKALGKGDQVYTCKASQDNLMQFTWVLARPRADLFNEQGAKIGKHYGGPTWESTDGSKVTGKLLERAGSPRPGAVPWLLLQAATHSGTGVFANITYVQRVDTEGGAPPADGCDASHAGAEHPVAYQASYYFYAAPAP
jgi:Protein of unknown function (DUF3455)